MQLLLGFLEFSLAFKLAKRITVSQEDVEGSVID